MPGTGEERPERVEEQLEEERDLEARVAALRLDPGLKDPAAMDVVFDLFNIWIGLYRLNKTDALLQEVAPLCEELGGPYHIKAIQMLGFCRWKQYRYAEALELFHKMEGMVGPSAALCENIGHTYSSMGDLDRAEAYFEKARALCPRGASERDGNLGGILLGLGLIKDRKGDVAGSLPVLQQSLDWYKDKFGGTDASLVAKAHMSVGKAHEKLKDLPAAEDHFAEALRIFEVTCGDDSPLSAGALASLGRVQQRQLKLVEAQRHLKRALALEGTKDSVHLTTVYELLTSLMDLHAHNPAGVDRSAFKQYVPILADTAQHMKAQGVPEDGDYGAFCKSAGEFCTLAEAYNEADVYLTKAIDILSSVTAIDCAHLVATCRQLLAYAHSQRG
jgi:tetratricopeptide (TPR) repeat protein